MTLNASRQAALSIRRFTWGLRKPFPHSGAPGPPRSPQREVCSGAALSLAPQAGCIHNRWLSSQPLPRRQDHPRLQRRSGPSAPRVRRRPGAAPRGAGDPRVRGFQDPAYSCPANRGETPVSTPNTTNLLAWICPSSGPALPTPRFPRGPRAPGNPPACRPPGAPGRRALGCNTSRPRSHGGSWGRR